MIELDEVLGRACSVVAGFAASESQRALLHHAIHLQAQRLSRAQRHISFRLPLLTYAAIRGDERPAIDLAAATLLLYMGTDLLDDLADGDMADEWRREDASQVQLLAIGLFATLPQLILTQIDAPPEVIVDLERAMLQASVRMGAGQRSDIKSRDDSARAADLQTAWDCIENKSGAAIALLGEAGSLLAGARELAPHYAAFGSALGSAFCLIKDCRNLMDGERSTDLMNGTRSYPVVLYLTGLRGEAARTDFAHLLHNARERPEARKEALARMTAAGTFHMTGLTIDTCRRRALKALEQAQPLEPAASALRNYLEFGRSGAA